MTNHALHIPILCYHRVAPQSERGSGSASLYVSPEQFHAQMRLLKRLGYQTLTAQWLVACRASRKNPPRKAILITFDDGYADNYTHAFPILKKFDMRALVFLVTSQIGGRNVWDLKSHSGSAGTPLLGRDQIQEMLESGIEFGSHTATHPDLTALSQEDTRRELESSKRAIEELTHRRDAAFCYPYARFHEPAKEEVKKAGYLCAFSGDNKWDPSAQSLFSLARVQVFPSTNLFGFWKKLRPWYPRWMSWSTTTKE